MPRCLVLPLVALGLLLSTGQAMARPLAAPHIEMAIDGSGRIVAGVGAGGHDRAGVIRLTAAGELDGSFAGDGTIGPFPSSAPAVVALQTDGDVIVADEPVEGLPLLRHYRAADGRLDRSFGHGGYTAIPVVPRNRVFAQPDGHIVVLIQNVCACGYELAYLQIMRYDDRGRLSARHTAGEEAWKFEAAAMDPRGYFVVQGNEGDLLRTTFTRFRPGGRIDPSLGGPHGLTIDEPDYEEAESPGHEEVRTTSRMALAPDGGIVTAFSGSETSISRRTPKGYADRQFGTAGEAICAGNVGGEGPTKPFDALSITPAGSILAAGGLRSCGVVRYLPDGQLDPSFGEGGHVDLGALGIPRTLAISLTPEGDIVVVGWNAATSAVEFARFTTDGHLDPTFGTSGVTSVTGF